jgi:hypothetical protein
MSWQETSIEEVRTRRSTHILQDRRGSIERRREEGKNGPHILLAHLPWEWARVERKEAQTPRLSIHTNS